MPCLLRASLKTEPSLRMQMAFRIHSQAAIHPPTDDRSPIYGKYIQDHTGIKAKTVLPQYKGQSPRPTLKQNHEITVLRAVRHKAEVRRPLPTDACSPCRVAIEHDVRDYAVAALGAYGGGHLKHVRTAKLLDAKTLRQWWSLGRLMSLGSLAARSAPPLPPRGVPARGIGTRDLRAERSRAAGERKHKEDYWKSHQNRWPPNVLAFSCERT
jgi:hypothetical protein